MYHVGRRWILFSLFLSTSLLQVIAMDSTQTRHTGQYLTTTEKGRILQRTAESLDCRKLSYCNEEIRSCYCDDLCTTYNDCCVNGSSNTSPKEMVDVKRKYATCEPVLTSSRSTIWAVSKCPKMEEQCFDDGVDADFLDMIPVVDEFNITYRNAKCARCHGVEQYTHWLAQVSPTVNSDRECRRLCDDDLGNTTNCIQTLLRKGCRLDLYIPTGFSARFCVQSEEISLQCSDTYLPIKQKLLQTDIKLYRNQDCCKKDGEVCNNETYECWHIPSSKNLESPRYGRSGSDVFQFSILFNLNEDCQHRLECGEVQYVGFTFDIVLRLTSKTPDLEGKDLFSILCLLMTYFDGMTDSLGMINVRMNIEKLSENGSFITLFVKLKSHSIFEREKDILQLKTHLGKVRFKISVEVENKNLQMESIKTNEQTWKNESDGKGIEFNVNHRLLSKRFSMFNDPVCMISNSAWMVPYARCDLVNINAVIDSGYPDITYECQQVAPDETNELHNDGHGLRLTSNFVYLNVFAMFVGVIAFQMFL